MLLETGHYHQQYCQVDGLDTVLGWHACDGNLNTVVESMPANVGLCSVGIEGLNEH